MDASTGEPGHGWYNPAVTLAWDCSGDFLMRRWLTVVMMMLVVLALLGTPALAGGLLDVEGGLQALTPFFIYNALWTALVSNLLATGCDGGG